jgi:hypothetical protein
MNAVDFFQNGGAGWKHARRSDCAGWNERRSFHFDFRLMVGAISKLNSSCSHVLPDYRC